MIRLLRGAYALARPVLFRLDAEHAHGLVMRAANPFLDSPLGDSVARSLVTHHPRLHRRVFGLDFPNPVGLAAGFDKNARYVRALSRLGFGHIEIGTVTGEGQPGNPRPRLFRLPHDEALLNRMGFNNAGSAAVERTLDQSPFEGILGVNIGKTKSVPLDEAPFDYEKSFRRLHRFASYFVVNVSSPNTPGLRELQDKEPLTRLLEHLQDVNEELASRGSRRPLLVKIAPDLEDAQIEDVMEVVQRCRLDGIVATNTTIDRGSLSTRRVEELGSGGISGRPVRSRARDIVRFIRRGAPDLPIIGVGGVFDAADAAAMMEAGADLVQVWTGFVYRGPTIVHDINAGLLE